MTVVRFHPEATDEAEGSVRWYNERFAGLGVDFRLELVATVERIADAPLRWPLSAYDPRARRCLMPRFPYGVVYVVTAEGDVVVVAVAHVRRLPRYWAHRL